MGRNQGLHDRVSAAILDAAASVLSERGDGAGMGEVASRAGVSRATLYRYFPCREDLLRALVEGSAIDPDDIERRLGGTIRQLFIRGTETGVLRPDLPTDVLLTLFGGLVKAGIHMATVDGLGVERASAALSSLFLEGAGHRVLVS